VKLSLCQKPSLLDIFTQATAKRKAEARKSPKFLRNTFFSWISVINNGKSDTTCSRVCTMEKKLFILTFLIRLVFYQHSFHIHQLLMIRNYNSLQCWSFFYSFASYTRSSFSPSVLSINLLWNCLLMLVGLTFFCYQLLWFFGCTYKHKQEFHNVIIYANNNERRRAFNGVILREK
jgi:hypothetical protein